MILISAKLAQGKSRLPGRSRLAWDSLYEGSMRIQSRYARFNGSRDEQLARLARDGWTVIRYKSLPLVVAYKVTSAGSIHAKAWRGNADKPIWNYLFSKMERAEKYVLEYAGKVQEWETYKKNQNAEKKAKRDALKASDHWSIGDVIYHSWGYDQTNVDFFQVIEVKARSIVIRSIMQNSSDHGGPTGGRCMPRRNEFVEGSKPMLKPLDERGEISGGSKWDGRSLYCSSYH